MRFNIKCEQKLNDGDTALSEEYSVTTEQDVNEVIAQYAARAISKSYVDSFSVKVEIVR